MGSNPLPAAVGTGIQPSLGVVRRVSPTASPSGPLLGQSAFSPSSNQAPRGSADRRRARSAGHRISAEPMCLQAGLQKHSGHRGTARLHASPAHRKGQADTGDGKNVDRRSRPRGQVYRTGEMAFRISVPNHHPRARVVGRILLRRTATGRNRTSSTRSNWPSIGPSHTERAASRICAAGERPSAVRVTCGTHAPGR